jgi:hypothetical protein
MKIGKIQQMNGITVSQQDWIYDVKRLALAQKSVLHINRKTKPTRESLTKDVAVPSYSEVVSMNFHCSLYHVLLNLV